MTKYKSHRWFRVLGNGRDRRRSRKQEFIYKISPTGVSRTRGILSSDDNLFVVGSLETKGEPVKYVAGMPALVLPNDLGRARIRKYHATKNNFHPIVAFDV